MTDLANGVDMGGVLSGLDAETEVLLTRMTNVFLEIDLQAEPVLGTHTGGEVLTHLAREADRMANALLEASDRPVPPTDMEREWGVSYGAHRPGAVLIDDITESAARLTEAIAGVEDWSAVGDAARAVPGQRLVQLVVHHCDLGRPWNEVDTTNAEVGLELLTTDMREELAGFTVVPQADQHITVTTTDGASVIEGDARALLAWVATRSAGSDAASSLPPLTERIWF